MARGRGDWDQYHSARQLRAQASQQRRQTEQHDKERKRQEVEAKKAEAERLTDDVEQRIVELEQVLLDGLDREPVTFPTLRDAFQAPRFDPRGLDVAEPPPRWEEPPPPTRLERLTGRYRHELDAHRRDFELLRSDHAAREHARKRELARQRKAHNRMTAEQKREHDAAIRRLEDGYHDADPEAVAEFFTRVVSRSVYPDGFPQRAPAIHYRAPDRHLAVERELPQLAVVPTDKEYRYVQARERIVAAPRAAKDIADRYRQLTCQVALRTLHEIFSADTDRHVDLVTLDGRVSTVNKATGRPDRPRLVSVRVTREQFEHLVLANVDPILCLKELDARVSPHPHDFEPVEPFYDFEALVAQLKLTESGDVLSSLDSRPDLLELSPWDFETFVKQLFEKMGKDRGWKTWKTQDVRDDGVDAVIVSDDPVFRGKCIVQAKRYRKIVPPAAVRELIGSVHNTDAAKGILVTTSWVGPVGHREAEQHGRIEIFDHENLTYLCKTYLGLDVLIGLRRLPPRRRRSS